MNKDGQEKEKNMQLPTLPALNGASVTESELHEFARKLRTAVRDYQRDVGHLPYGTVENVKLDEFLNELADRAGKLEEAKLVAPELTKKK